MKSLLSSWLYTSRPNPKLQSPRKPMRPQAGSFVVSMLFSGLLLTACDGGSGGGGQAGPDERQLVSALEFADPNLAGCVQREAVGAGWLYADEIEELNCANLGIASLGGLEIFADLPNVSLSRLDLRLLDAAVSDLGPLTGLQSVASLHLTGHSAADIEPLGSLSGLRELELAGVIHFSDAGGCAGSATSPVDDFSPLAGLSGLRLLTLYGCFDTQDYSFVNNLEALEELGLLRNASLAQLPALDKLGQLRALNLSGSPRIQDIDTISSLAALQYLVLPGDLTWGAGGLAPLAGLVNLRDLVLEDAVITGDLGPLAGLASLESLTMRWWELDYEPRGKVTDLSPLATLQKLSRLRLEHQQISDIGPLAALPGLVELSLDDNQVSDLNPLSGLPELVELSLSYNQLSDLNPLASVSALRELNLRFNQISDLTALAGLDSVTALDLYANPLTELDPLVDMLALERLSISDQVSCSEAREFQTTRPDVLLDYGRPCPP
ncbi:MAG: leucine-rich repeat domain-containing protein [Halieaceae bacterium]|jgi:internalin A|nr:leucine-rich repeat domain-containing protein [Halieaceae bacterium]